MYFVFFGQTVSEICKADAIACNYIEKLSKTAEFWHATRFVVNSPIAKLAEFWLDNEDNLANAIAAQTFQIKTILELTRHDYEAMNSLKNVRQPA